MSVRHIDSDASAPDVADVRIAKNPTTGGVARQRAMPRVAYLE
jgi:hypothetical protein